MNLFNHKPTRVGIIFNNNNETMYKNIRVPYMIYKFKAIHVGME